TGAGRSPAVDGPPPERRPGASSEGGGEKPSAPVLEFREEVGKTSRYVLRAPAFNAVVGAARRAGWVVGRPGGEDGRGVFTGTQKGGKEQPNDAGSETRLNNILGRTQNADLPIGETKLSLAGKQDAYRVDVTLVPPGRRPAGRRREAACRRRGALIPGRRPLGFREDRGRRRPARSR
ncbi:hypothetical protein, partial [Hydrogenibacillus schlegelii]|uniref:hypothetical protein n=1 Tax=Hydrogenibacillus schlegelii TaxID=1484 RepID=UPI0034A0A80D